MFFEDVLGKKAQYKLRAAGVFLTGRKNLVERRVKPTQNKEIRDG